VQIVIYAFPPAEDSIRDVIPQLLATQYHKAWKYKRRPDKKSFLPGLPDQFAEVCTLSNIFEVLKQFIYIIEQRSAHASNWPHIHRLILRVYMWLTMLCSHK